MNDDFAAAEDLHHRALEQWRANYETDSASELYVHADRVIASGIHTELHVSKRARNWATTLRRYEQFWRDSGRTARENTSIRASLPAYERWLGQWARYQRRVSAHLTGFQVARLEISPAFSWDPVDSAWNARFGACLRHLEAQRRLPLLSGDNAEEFALARWLNRKLRQLQIGTQPPARAIRLAELLNPPVSDSQ